MMPSVRPGLEAALDLAANEALTAALLDVNLAGVLVWPMTTLLHNRHVPFVLLTGFGSGISLPANRRGVPRLDKPFTETGVLDTRGRLCGHPAA
jgi:hypothetical protein